MSRLLRALTLVLALQAPGCERVVHLGRLTAFNDGGDSDAAPAPQTDLAQRGIFQHALYDLSDPAAIAVADLDEDGRLDLALSRRGPGQVALLLSQGDGGLRALTPLSVGAGADALALADLDGDGHRDLAVATTAGLALWTAAGPVSFRSAALHPLAPAVSLAVGDVDGDGRPDIVAASTGAGQVQLLLSQGAALTAAPRSPLRLTLPAPPSAVALADLDQDGRLDLVAAAGGALYHLRNRGADLAGPFAPPTAYPVDADLSALLLRDVDGDGQVDVITSAAGGTVYVLRNLGGGVLEIDKLWARYGAAPGARALVLAQLDGDGRPDLLTANRDASTLSLLRGGPGGLFQRPALGFGTEAAPVALAALDLDGDGRADLAVACQGSAHLQVLLSRL